MSGKHAVYFNQFLVSGKIYCENCYWAIITYKCS